MEDNNKLSQENQNIVKGYKTPITITILVALVVEFFIPMGWIAKIILMIVTAVIIVLGFSFYINSKIKKK